MVPGMNLNVRVSESKGGVRWRFPPARSILTLWCGELGEFPSKTKGAVLVTLKKKSGLGIRTNHTQKTQCQNSRKANVSYIHE
jgi:hypothetical protein